MLRRLLRDGGAERAFLEKLDIFQQNPGLLEKYLIGSEVSLAVLDLFMSRLFGSEGLSGVADAKEAVESVMNSPSVEEKSGRACDEHCAVVEELQQQVLDLTRQFSALQRQLQMQGEVSQVAVSIEGRLDEVTCACERRVAETEEALHAEIRKVDVSSKDVARDLGELKGELEQRASVEDLKRLEEEVLRLKEAECGLDSRILAVEARATESERMLREDVQLKPEKIDMKSDPLDGIIAHLTRGCGGNVHKKGVVKVTASDFKTGHDPENAVEFRSNFDFMSQNLPDSWICYDFKGRRVTPTSYSIKSYGYGPGGGHPKSWVLEVSNDGSEGSWKVVDSRENNEDLNSSHVTRNFAVSAPPCGEFRFVRLRHTGKNHFGNNDLVICSLEIFGALSRE